MHISDFFYIWKTNRMVLFCNLFIERTSYKTCKAPVKSSPSTSNISTDRMPSRCPTNSVRALKESRRSIRVAVKSLRHSEQHWNQQSLLLLRLVLLILPVFVHNPIYLEFTPGKVSLPKKNTQALKVRDFLQALTVTQPRLSKHWMTPYRTAPLV